MTQGRQRRRYWMCCCEESRRSSGSLEASPMQQEAMDALERRLGRVHAKQRLGIEKDHEDVFGRGINFFHPENWYSAHALLRRTLKLAGLYGRGQRNTERIRLVNNTIVLPGLPERFEGFTLLQLSDLHADMNPGPIVRLIEMLATVRC